jgi:hypothetical protein
MTKKIIFALCLLAACGSAGAQNGRHIDAIFDEYGKQQGAVLIELAKDVLGRHSRIDRYKSLAIPINPDIVRLTLTAIRADLKDGKILMESQKDGITETGYYHLPRTGNLQEYEYILFSSKSRKMTLIYIRGDFPPARLELELDKLKDLFIRINNKQIKL